MRNLQLLFYNDSGQAYVLLPRGNVIRIDPPHYFERVEAAEGELARGALEDGTFVIPNEEERTFRNIDGVIEFLREHCVTSTIEDMESARSLLLEAPDSWLEVCIEDLAARLQVPPRDEDYLNSIMRRVEFLLSLKRVAYHTTWRGGLELMHSTIKELQSGKYDHTTYKPHQKRIDDGYTMEIEAA